VLLTRSPLSPGPKSRFSLDSHSLSTPLACVLSQDQTLRSIVLGRGKPRPLVDGESGRAWRPWRATLARPIGVLWQPHYPVFKDRARQFVHRRQEVSLPRSPSGRQPLFCAVRVWGLPTAGPSSGPTSEQDTPPRSCPSTPFLTGASFGATSGRFTPPTRADFMPTRLRCQGICWGSPRCTSPPSSPAAGTLQRGLWVPGGSTPRLRPAQHGRGAGGAARGHPPGAAARRARSGLHGFAGPGRSRSRRYSLGPRGGAGAPAASPATE
jgi:hypothetical protein